MEPVLSQKSPDRLEALARHRSHASRLTAKRLVDIGLILLSLPILIPMMLVIGVFIKLDSRGPVIFKQKRAGLRLPSGDNLSPARLTNFTMYKFRTMHVNADAEIHRQFMQAYIAGDKKKMASLQPDSAQGEAFKLHNDPRTTRVGRFLRKLSLDELPQVFNVLKGDMSLVGPRPAIPYEVEMYSPEHLRRLDTLPGITGLWQVSGRTTTGFDEMIRLDLDYIQQQSVWLDLKIIFQTIPAVISRKGAG